MQLLKSQCAILLYTMRKLYTDAKKVMHAKMPEHHHLALQLELVLQYMYVVYFEEMTVRLVALCVMHASIGCGLARVGSRSTKSKLVGLSSLAVP